MTTIATPAPASLKSETVRPARRQLYGLLAFGLAIEAGLVVIVGLGHLTQQVGGFLVVVAGLFIAFVLACWWVLRRQQADNPATLKATLLIVLGLAAIFRLTLVWAAPSLSTDEFRYIWEGRLLGYGVSPYQYAPTDPALISYHSPIWQLVQQRETPSPYPPLAQLIGLVGYKIWGESLLGPKFMAILWDGLTIAALMWLLKILKLDRRRVILYAWCPLPIIEFGLGGHNDAPMLCLLLMAVGLAIKGRPGWSAAVLGLAILAKITPVFLVPVFVMGGWQALRQDKPSWHWRQLWRLKALRYPALTMTVVLVGYLPLLILGGGAIGSLFEYTGAWRINDALVYQLIADSLGLTVAKAVTLLILAIGIAFVSLHPRLVTLSLPRRLLLVLSLTLMVASTVHPWYITWVLVLLPLVLNFKSGWAWFDIGWYLFAALIQLVYLSYQRDESVFIWLRPLEYGLIYGLAGISIAKLRMKDEG